MPTDRFWASFGLPLLKGDGRGIWRGTGGGSEGGLWSTVLYGERKALYHVRSNPPNKNAWNPCY